MSDMVGNPEDRFSGIVAHIIIRVLKVRVSLLRLLYEPPRGKTNNVVSEQVRHKPTCTSTEKSQKLEISDLKRRESVLSVKRKQRR